MQLAHNNNKNNGSNKLGLTLAKPCYIKKGTIIAKTKLLYCCCWFNQLKFNYQNIQHTCVNQKLVCKAWMVNIMNSCRKECWHNFQRCEYRLKDERKSFLRVPTSSWAWKKKKRHFSSSTSKKATKFYIINGLKIEDFSLEMGQGFHE